MARHVERCLRSVFAELDASGLAFEAIIVDNASVDGTIQAPAGLPVGLRFFGTAWSDAKLLALALHFEQVTRQRTMPGFRARSA